MMKRRLISLLVNLLLGSAFFLGFWSETYRSEGTGEWGRPIAIYIAGALLIFAGAVFERRWAGIGIIGQVASSMPLILAATVASAFALPDVAKPFIFWAALCLPLLALACVANVIPWSHRTERPPNQASEATSEPARSAGSSSPQG